MSLSSSFLTRDFQEVRWSLLYTPSYPMKFTYPFPPSLMFNPWSCWWSCAELASNTSMSFLHQRRAKLDTTVQLWPHKCQTDGIASLGYYPECLFSFLRCKHETNLEQLLPSHPYFLSHWFDNMHNAQKYVFALAPITQWQHINYLLFGLNSSDLFRGHYRMGQWNFGSRRKKSSAKKYLNCKTHQKM